MAGQAPRRVRRSLTDLQDDYALGNTAALESLWRAWKGIKELPPDDANSFFTIVSASTDAAMADDVIAFTKANLPADSMVEAERVAAAIRTRAEIKARLMPQLDKALK